MYKLVVFAALLAAVSAGFLPLDYHYPAHTAVVVHKPVASSYTYFNKVDHSVPVIKTVVPAPVVASPFVYKPLPYHGYHGLPLSHGLGHYPSYHSYGHF